MYPSIQFIRKYKKGSMDHLKSHHGPPVENHCSMHILSIVVVGRNHYNSLAEFCV